MARFDPFTTMPYSDDRQPAEVILGILETEGVMSSYTLSEITGFPIKKVQWNLQHLVERGKIERIPGNLRGRPSRQDAPPGPARVPHTYRAVGTLKCDKDRDAFPAELIGVSSIFEAAQRFR